jgi:hypothetical protein
MSQSYQMNDSNVYGQQLLVQEICIPFTITANATAASVSSTVDQPAVLFLNLASNNNVTSSTGALPSGATLPTTYFGGTSLPATSSGATSVFYTYVKLNQYVKKVLNSSIITTTPPSASATAGFSVIGIVPDAVAGATVTVPTPSGVTISTPAGASSDGQGFYILFSSSNLNFSTTNFAGVFTAKFEVYS